jgi:hypothetical protein
MENETIDRLQAQFEEIFNQNQFLADKIQKLEAQLSERVSPTPSKPFSSLGTNNNGCISRKHSPPSQISPTT